MKLKIAVLVVAVVAVTAVMGSSAFTTATVQRSSSVNVVADDVGLVGLSPGSAGGLVDKNGTGQLTIDFTRGTANGANANATFELGDPNSPTTAPAFNVTNNDAESHSFDLSYTGATDDGDNSGTNNIEFQVYNSTGSSVGTVSDESTSLTLTGVSPGETHYVVVVVDTNGLTTAADLSGTLEVSV